MPNSLEVPKFFVDAMLGNIAKKLRLLGYDTKYSSNIDDNDLVQLAKKDNRIIISKDIKLIENARNFNIKSILVSKKSEKEQLLEIIDKVNIKKLIIDGNIARCSKCNGHTKLIKKENIQNKVPKRVLEYNEKFWKCNDCNQVYWEGTHITKLKNYFSSLK